MSEKKDADYLKLLKALCDIDRELDEDILKEMQDLKECGFDESVYGYDGSDGRLTDREFLKKVVAIDGGALERAPENLKYDRELLLIAAANDKDLWFKIKLPEELRTDVEFMLQLVSVNGKLLNEWRFTGFEPFTEDEKKLILAAAKNDYTACNNSYIKWKFQYNTELKDFALELVAINGRILQYLGNGMRNDEDIVLKAIEYTYRPFEFASIRLKNNEKFLLRAMEINACCLAYAPKSMREDRALVERLMQKTPFVYRYAKGEMENDANLALQAVKGAPQVYDYLDYEMTHRNEEFVKGLDKLVNSEEISAEAKDFLTTRLKINSFYLEKCKPKFDLNKFLTDILTGEDVAEVFLLEYRMDMSFQREVDKHIPEVLACFGQKQRGKWHIYGVMKHILKSVEEMNRLTVKLPFSERRLLSFTMFFHDLGKPEYHTEKIVDGEVCDSFKGHNKGSERTAKRVLKLFDFTAEEKKIILTLVREHDVFMKFSDEPNEAWQIEPTAENLKKYIEGLSKSGDGKRIFEYLVLVGIADNKAQNRVMTKKTLDLIYRLRALAENI